MNEILKILESAIITYEELEILESSEYVEYVENNGTSALGDDYTWYTIYTGDIVFEVYVK